MSDPRADAIAVLEWAGQRTAKCKPTPQMVDQFERITAALVWLRSTPSPEQP